jgi:hypothetical protein
MVHAHILSYVSGEQKVPVQQVRTRGVQTEIVQTYDTAMTQRKDIAPSIASGAYEKTGFPLRRTISGLLP